MDKNNVALTQREIEQRRVTRLLKRANEALKEANAAALSSKRDAVIMHTSDAVVHLIHVGDMLEEGIMPIVFKKLQQDDRLEDNAHG